MLPKELQIEVSIPKTPLAECKTFNWFKGEKGDKGDKGDTGNTGATGQDGFSPTANVTKAGDILTVSITDKNGTTTESLDIGGKVDLDATNLSDAGKSLIATLGMPSTIVAPLTLGASGSTYTAPANGYFVLQKETSNTQFIALTNIGLMTSMESSAGSQIPTIWVPCLKGQTVAATYSGTGQVYLFNFIYAEGSKQEAN